MRRYKELLRDPRAYIEYIGKKDRKNTLEALATEGEDTIVRVCFSVPDRNPPLRTLGYFAAARHITEKYLPKAQLQFVATVNTNARINGIPRRNSEAGARLLFRTAATTPGLATGLETNVVYAFDKLDLPKQRVDRIIPILRNKPEAQHLARSADRRGSQFPEYVAAHLSLHDGVDVIDAVDSKYFPNNDPLTEAERLISIGAQSERNFYNARWNCRSAMGDMFPGMIEKTGQLFTRHVLPPYLPRRQDKEHLLFDPTLRHHEGSVRSFLEEVSSRKTNFILDKGERDLRYLQVCLTDTVSELHKQLATIAGPW